MDNQKEVALATLNYLDLCEEGTPLHGVMETHLTEKESETLLLTQEQPNRNCQCSLNKLAHHE